MECPILVWMMVYNRPFKPEEYEKVYQTVQICVPHAQILYEPGSKEMAVKSMAYLMPLLMMRHRRIPRSKWRDSALPNGKRWIEQAWDRRVDPMRRMHSFIGYHIGMCNNLIGMVMVQGRQRDIVTSGIGIQQLGTVPPDTSISDYLESNYHKLTQREIESLGEDEETMLRRLCLLLALKKAYLEATGNTMVDHTIIEFDIPNEKVYHDGKPLDGWEFRVWTSALNVSPTGNLEDLVDQEYQCATAFFRGHRGSRFIWQRDRKQLESWVQFLSVDQLLLVLPKLAD
ncbi:hypothetical protein K474DRAFT_1174996 [Panus rudis PR-1116 ss-1]|nr:hypothetical protein K474DRAFT_1174996 [Panus rudis PR-1116 ss-1]